MVWIYRHSVTYICILTCGARNMTVGRSSRHRSSFQGVSLQGGSNVGAGRPLRDKLRPSATSISMYSDTWETLKIQSSRQETSQPPWSEVWNRMRKRREGREEMNSHIASLICSKTSKSTVYLKVWAQNTSALPGAWHPGSHHPSSLASSPADALCGPESELQQQSDPAGTVEGGREIRVDTRKDGGSRVKSRVVTKDKVVKGKCHRCWHILPS